MTQECLSGSATVAINYDIAQHLSCKDIIDDFASKKKKNSKVLLTKRRTCMFTLDLFVYFRFEVIFIQYVFWRASK